jgi:DNA-binding response OmpR family regulator
MRLLIADHDANFADQLIRRLRQDGWAVDCPRDADDATEACRLNSYDVAAIDDRLDREGGLQVIKQLRAVSPGLPILLLTSDPAPAQRARALDHGADDCLSKPVSYRELSARLRALTRRPSRSEPAVLEAGDLRIDLSTATVTRGGGLLELRRKERELLAYLMRNGGRVVSHEELLEHVWDSEANPFTNAVRVHITSLRKALGDSARDPRYIRTVPGEGYIVGWAPPEDVSERWGSGAHLVRPVDSRLTPILSTAAHALLRHAANARSLCWRLAQMLRPSRTWILPSPWWALALPAVGALAVGVAVLAGTGSEPERHCVVEAAVMTAGSAPEDLAPKGFQCFETFDEAWRAANGG